jgi:hypothetical protein
MLRAAVPGIAQYFAHSVRETKNLIEVDGGKFNKCPNGPTEKTASSFTRMQVSRRSDTASFGKITKQLEFIFIAPRRR